MAGHAGRGFITFIGALLQFGAGELRRRRYMIKILLTLEVLQCASMTEDKTSFAQAFSTNLKL